MSETSPTPFTASLLFVGDAFGGVEHGTAHLVAHRLILNHPEIDFTFWFALEEANPIAKIYKESFRTIVSRSPERIVCTIGFSDLQQESPANQFAETAELLIREITSKCHHNALFCSPPPLTFAAHPLRMVLAEEYELVLAKLCEENGVHHLRLSAHFNDFIKGLALHQGSIYALHQGDGSLTPFGQMFLAEKFLRSTLLQCGESNSSELEY